MYMFGIAITQLVAEYWSENTFLGNAIHNKDDLTFYFGSVANSIFTLFMTIAGGIDWKDAAKPLFTVGPLAVTIYLVFVLLMVLCVMNVLTGIFCQSAIETAQHDRENVMRVQLQEKNNFVGTLQMLFATWDESGDGSCTRDEFCSHLDDPETQALLRTLEIESRDALALFDILDTNGTGEIDLDEFVTGCITMRGAAKAVHMEKVAAMSARLADSVDTLEKDLKEVSEVIKALGRLPGTRATGNEQAKTTVRGSSSDFLA